jgi:glycosyltransferase involved in cell wall biosynthesis
VRLPPEQQVNCLHLGTSPFLKVLHVISGDLWAGAEAQALTLLSALHRLDVVVAVALMNDGELAARLRSRGISVHIFDESRLNGAQILLALRRLMLEFRPNIVHTHRTKENILGSLANRLSCKAACVRTVHGDYEDSALDLRRISRQFILQLDRWSANHLQHRVIAASKELGEKLKKRFSPGRIVVIENGVDVDAVQRQVHSVDFRDQAPTATHIGIVGRLVPVKRMDLFLECAAILRDLNPARAWRFHIFGDGPLRNQLAEYAERLAIEDVVTFHGHRDDVIACLAALDVMTICSDHEGLPIVLLEAIVVDTPIVARATGGIIDVMGECGKGLLVRDHTAGGYADAIRAILERPEPWPRGVQFPERFTSAHNAQSVRHLYELLATENSRCA